MLCLVVYLMLSRLSLITLLVLAVFAGYTDNTEFWRKQVQGLPFEAYSGFQEIDNHFPVGTTGMHYQLFSKAGESAKSGSSETTPLFLWLQGGPGSSSLFGAYTQIGPVLITDGKAVANNQSWNTLGHLLFVDSPLNVGFSFSSGDRKGDKQVNSTEDATNHLVNFLENFYKTWPHLKKNPLYLTGQSYAGHYIPSLAKKILARDSQSKFNLVGVAIGDGWTDPINQGNYYDTFLWSVGVIENKFRDVCNWYQKSSILSIHQGDYENATSYFDFLTNNDTTPQTYLGNISMFNFRNYDGVDRSFAKFITDNKEALGINSSLQYIRSNPKIYTAFALDISKSFAKDVNSILAQVKTLIFNGQNDVVVNTPGVLQYINSLRWKGTRGWKRTKKQIWKVNGEVAGWSKVHDNLWFVLVNGAGHMVPTNQPERARVMMEHFVTNNNHWDM